MKANQQNQIEAYLSGEMNAEQLAKFESDLQINPELQKELNFQSDVIQGIGEFRKNQLITRLDALNVPSAWWSYIQHSSILQYFGGVVVTGLIGVGIWFILPSDNSNLDLAVVDELIIDDPKPESFVWNLPELKKQKIVAEDSSEETDLTHKDENKETKVSAKLFSPIVTVPSAGDIEAEKDFVPEEAGNPSKIEKTNVDENRPISVEIIESESFNVKYRYYDGKLYLYGKFNKDPYEILEINSASERRIYLYHGEIFYQIGISDVPVDLKEITNSKLIQELAILRKTK